MSTEMITIPGRDWRLLAACRHADPELFFPVSASGPSLDQVTQAKAICARCPVRQQCLAFALNTRQDHGVWGGTSEEERRPRGNGNVYQDLIPAPVADAHRLAAGRPPISRPLATAETRMARGLRPQPRWRMVGPYCWW
jgi:WhiB family transcriptional regulator, redox-sensing transcriptional regulator